MTLEEDGGRKDYLKNSAVNMATIFGVRADAYSLNTPTPPSLHVYTKRRTTPLSGGVVLLLVLTCNEGGGGVFKEYASALTPKMVAILTAEFFYNLYVPHLPRVSYLYLLMGQF